MIQKNKNIFVLLLGLVLFVSTGLVNIGIIALDDYEFGVSRVIPAQQITFKGIIELTNIRSPVSSLFLATISKLALSMGIETPADQMRFICAVLGFFSCLVLWFYSGLHFKEEKRKITAQIFVLFYFLSPFLYTRPLIESLSTPFLLISAYFACQFYESKRISSVYIAVFSLALAAAMRFQAGVCFGGLVAVVLFSKNRKAIFHLAIASVVAFTASGLLDYYLTGGFHRSLIAYVVYNIHFSHIYGRYPFYVFPLLFIGVSIPPVFISRYRNIKWQEEYRFLLPVLAYFIVFLVAHVLVPHKEDRFMVPVLPLFLILLVPLFHHIRTVEKSYWRVGLFAGVNILLLPFASFNVAQNNIIGLTTYIHKNSNISKVIGLGETLILYPKAFIVRDHEQGSVNSVNEIGQMKCSDILVIRKDIKAKLASFSLPVKKTMEFSPGILEAILIRLNPRHNIRRNTIELYQRTDCPVVQINPIPISG